MGRTLLEPGCAYHIYNHAVGKDRLFVTDDNYLYFLKRFQYFIPPVADTYAYCLMSNHIHLLVTIKDQILIPENSVYTAERFVSKQFSNLFSSYSQAFNKQQQRMGNLFISNFKRRKIGSDEDFTNVIRYIHLNPTNHRIIQDFSKWKYSSYHAICSNSETFLAKEKVLKWFGNKEAFIQFHQRSIK